ncbi:acetoacetyl-CoA reductase [Roseovarius gahaiensis]|uniref:Acetoacetyl-CoA reductase n=1 Tax=Roseovarius gahaiensis TaxID=2716691 RepID=A0A967BF38_9RHOB|nr:acetoacetyl-CoA reductase [Roseovarius gahaiensis]NHQ75400.1 acetoacetyl-CoA reductase [Roseovarius gahaiensis]
MTNQNRSALVTGGVQGLGAAAAQALADAGVTVAAAHLGAGDRAKAFADETGIPVFEWDVSDYDACTQGLKDVEEAIGPLDILVNNAGVNRDVMFHKMGREDWDAVIGVDLGAMFNVTRQVIGGMRDRGFGRIINISSVNAARGQMGQTNYCAAKAGVEGFTRALARESAAKGITVNAIAPGYADTAMVEAVPDDMIESILDMVPMSRLADPDEIGRCVRFLASDDSAFITGATLPVNGGLHMG